MHISLQPLGECHCWWTRVFPRAHVAKFYVRFQLIRSVLRASKFSGVKFIEFIILWIYYMASLLASASFLVIFDISFLNYLVWLRITDEGSVPEVHIWSILLMKSHLKWCTHLDLFILQPLQSLGECHCWWTRESLRAHSAKFNGRLQLIRSVSRVSQFSVLKFIEIEILGVYSPSLFASVCFDTFLISLFNFFLVCLPKGH